MRGSGTSWPALAAQVAAAPRMRQALTVLMLVAALGGHGIRSFVGWPGFVAIVAALAGLAILSLLGQREELEWRGILPISLLAFFAWVVLSAIWSSYTWATAGGIAMSLAWGLLGVYVALSRDLIQLVRAAGDALRGILVASVVLEVLSGIVLDVPFRFIGIAGNLAVGGPIQGVAGTRNALCFLAGLAVITFWVEFRTRSVRRGVSIGSLVVAVACVLLSRSPVTFTVLAVVGVAGLALVAIRRMSPERRALVQPMLLGATVLAGIVAWALRGPILALVNARSDLETRLGLWASLRELIALRGVEGWGWVGRWPVEVYPFSTIRTPTGGQATSALSAVVDVWFQLGVVGVALLAGALGLGFVRAWLVASEARSTVNVWPALVLALLGVTSLAESYLLSGGLVLAVAACIAAARKRSWRERLR
jgi:exopolysaccharide production protein ExoQ